MKILETLIQRSGESGLEFLVIGGLAINAHGYERQTADIDILVCGDQRENWRALMISLGYRIFHEQGTFAQFSPSEKGVWPVDVMFVNARTFANLAAESLTVKINQASVRIPSVEHLIALKLHALKFTHPRRELKDLLDVINLIDANKIDINGDDFKKLCDRHGSQKIYAQIIAASSR